jgi:predicted DNA-binding protein (UPF0278 family)
MDLATQFVRDLAVAIPRGGDEADDAVRALGLLIERERITHSDSGAVVVKLRDPRRSVLLGYRVTD